MSISSPPRNSSPTAKRAEEVAGVLVDTSAWVEALRRDGNGAIRDAVGAATRDGRVVFCEMVLLELWNGARGDAERRVLRALESDLVTLPTTPDVWRLAREMGEACRRQGITVPATDLLIAAFAQHHALDLLHNDRHFPLIASVTP